MKVLKNFKKLNFGIAVRAVAIATTLTVVLSLCRFNARCENIRESVLRLHILANSDLKSDQELKLKVRDAVLVQSDEMFLSAKNEAEAVKIAKENIAFLTDIADKTIKENGYDYKVQVSVEEVWFDERVYDDFTLPAGNYEALRIIIGEGEGKNWWCVMFPSVCIPTATQDNEISSVLDKDETDMVKQPEKYVVKFKVVELFEKAKSKLQKWFS